VRWLHRGLNGSDDLRAGHLQIDIVHPSSDHRRLKVTAGLQGVPEPGIYLRPDASLTVR
jgi:hypothetical protein